MSFGSEFQPGSIVWNFQRKTARITARTNTRCVLGSIEQYARARRDATAFALIAVINVVVVLEGINPVPYLSIAAFFAFMSRGAAVTARRRRREHERFFLSAERTHLRSKGWL